MNRYIALLRGINVSGQKLIKMPDLKILAEETGFGDVSTYIQSGNLLFSFDDVPAADLETMLENAILQRFNFVVTVIVLQPQDLEQAIRQNPFHDHNLSRLYLTFLKDFPEPEKVEALREVDHQPEAWELRGRNLYFYSPKGYGRAKMNNNFFENKLKVQATTRNWKTVNKLFELATS